MAVDPTAKFVYVANFYNADVWGYSIGSNGALTPVPDRPSKPGPNPFQSSWIRTASSSTW